MAKFDNSEYHSFEFDDQNNESHEHNEWFDPEEFDSTTAKIALGGVAAAGLLASIYAIVRARGDKHED